MVEMRPSQRPSQNQSDSWWRIYDGMSGVHLRDTLGHLFTDCDMDNDGLLNQQELQQFIVEAKTAFKLPKARQAFESKWGSMDEPENEDKTITLDDLYNHALSIVSTKPDAHNKESQTFRLSSKEPTEVYPGFIPPIQFLID